MAILVLVQSVWCRVLRGHRWALVGSRRQYLKCIFCPAWRDIPDHAPGAREDEQRDAALAR